MVDSTVRDCLTCRHYEPAASPRTIKPTCRDCYSWGLQGVPLPYWEAKVDTEVEIVQGKPMTNDNVNHPDHYTVGGIETLDFIRAKLPEDEFAGYCKGNALKYISRASHKGKEMEDLKKAAFYLKVLTED